VSAGLGGGLAGAPGMATAAWRPCGLPESAVAEVSAAAAAVVVAAVSAAAVVVVAG
jgi:hypothetical protein